MLQGTDFCLQLHMPILWLQHYTSLFGYCW